MLLKLYDKIIYVARISNMVSLRHLGDDLTIHPHVKLFHLLFVIFKIGNHCTHLNIKVIKQLQHLTSCH